MADLFVVRAKIVAAAISQLGVPYVYGGTTPGVGLDCSGLAQWACARAGVAVPRGSSAQFTSSGPRVAGDLAPPGCLAFFYGAPGETSRPGHVGIVTGPGQMIDAPYTGQVVRYDTFSTTPTIGPMDFWGFTDPAALIAKETDVMYLIECNDSPYGDKSWFTLAGGVAVHIPDPETLNVLNTFSVTGDVVKVPEPCSWAWLGQYVPGKDATA